MQRQLHTNPLAQNHGVLPSEAADSLEDSLRAQPGGFSVGALSRSMIQDVEHRNMFETSEPDKDILPDFA